MKAGKKARARQSAGHRAVTLFVIVSFGKNEFKNKFKTNA